MAIQKTDAIIIRTQPFRSSSLIVTFFTKDFGKLKGIAKGVRRERELRGPLYELFTHLEIVFYEKMRSDLHLISEASMIESHDGLRSRLESIAYASYYAELLDQLCETHDAHEELYDLLSFVLGLLPSVPPEKLSRIFEMKLIREVGWIPYLEGCLECKQPITKEIFFSISQGALFCERCVAQVPEAKQMNVEVVNAMRYLVNHNLDQCAKWATTDRLLRELGYFLDQFILYRLGKNLKTKRFMHQTFLAPGSSRASGSGPIPLKPSKASF